MPAIAGLEMVLAELPPDQRALVVQVLALNDQQIAVLPDAQRQQVQQVRQMVINKLTGQALPGGFRM
jgi:DNA-directed RNA polymerase specialized sigma24 family protein